MDIFGPLSPRATDFSISSLMSHHPSTLDSLLVTSNSCSSGKPVLASPTASVGAAPSGGGVGSDIITHCGAAGVPAQRSTDCVFDWTQVPAYSTSINSMEGRPIVYLRECILYNHWMSFIL